MFKWKTILRDLLIFLLIGTIISIIFEGGKLSLEPGFLWNIVYSSILCYLLAMGNTLIFIQLDQRISWVAEPVKRLLIQFLSHTFYSGAVIFILNILLLLFVYPEAYAEGNFSAHLKSNLIVGLIITIFVLLVIQGERFFDNWKISLIRAERLEKEKALTRYQALRAQVNPHFLFNSLNTLSGLITQDPVLADRYLGKLSEVYRYVLANQEKEAIRLEEELEFIKAYVYLLNIRYNDQISCEISYSEGRNDFFIIPLGLQILVENVIKHNRISEKEPLIIEITIANTFLTVKNEKRLRSQTSSSLGKGLDNLKERYKYLSSRNVEIKETEAEFVVKIPLLEHEDSHH
ncbi:MAG: histidine kinase [Bacteroidetes bacterium]|nr:histidine kinase [Bacteroidota bacterium]